jgi:hypothetical protein
MENNRMTVLYEARKMAPKRPVYAAAQRPGNLEKDPEEAGARKPNWLLLTGKSNRRQRCRPIRSGKSGPNIEDSHQIQ